MVRERGGVQEVESRASIYYHGRTDYSILCKGITQYSTCQLWLYRLGPATGL